MLEVNTGVAGKRSCWKKNQAYIFAGKLSNYIFVENKSPLSGLLVVSGLKIIKEI